METEELFDLLERCSKLSIRGNTKAIQQASALVERITALETAGRKITRGRDFGKLAPDNFDGHFIINIGAMRELAALLGETK